MSLHRAVMVRKDLPGAPGLVKDEVKLGAAYVIDMDRRTLLRLRAGDAVDAAWIRRVDNGAEGFAPLGLFEIDEGEVKE